MRKIRKSMLLLLAVLLVPCAALAEAINTVSDIAQQAAFGWHQTYQAHGRTITVNIDIQVPNVETMPVLLARPHMPSPQIPQNEGNALYDYEIDNSLIYENKPGGFTWIYGDKSHRQKTDKLAIAISGYSDEILCLKPVEVD